MRIFNLLYPHKLNRTFILFSSYILGQITLSSQNKKDEEFLLFFYDRFNYFISRN